eukprot:TRINITY_DN9133_c0_g1_i1.p1 TRINITY_DN9133_c0_g1~~TRINITY_DN9133_c0_g1_i1.p1  ORF type:complete len:502 (+),score=118.30 TRINITY_DN9133_c0_g1_i1:69-1508(+)
MSSASLKLLQAAGATCGPGSGGSPQCAPEQSTRKGASEVLIFLRLPDGDTVPVEVPSDSNVGDLREALIAQKGEEMRSTGLLWEGEVLDDTTTLADAGIGTESVVAVRAGGLTSEVALELQELRAGAEEALRAHEAAVAGMNEHEREVVRAITYALGGARLQCLEQMDGAAWSALWADTASDRRKKWHDAIEPSKKRAKTQLIEAMERACSAMGGLVEKKRTEKKRRTKKPTTRTTLVLTPDMDKSLRACAVAAVSTVLPLMKLFFALSFFKLPFGCWRDKEVKWCNDSDSDSSYTSDEDEEREDTHISLPSHKVTGPEAITKAHLKLASKMVQGMSRMMSEITEEMDDMFEEVSGVSVNDAAGGIFSMAEELHCFKFLDHYLGGEEDSDYTSTTDCTEDCDSDFDIARDPRVREPDPITDGSSTCSSRSSRARSPQCGNDAGVAELVSMGFEAEGAKRALLLSEGNVQRAVDRLLSQG